MVSERTCRLLTAYVDGEMNSRDRKALEQLLEQSAEARTLLSKLQNDAGTLRDLSRLSLDADFTERVMRRLTERRTQPASRLRRSESAFYPGWAGVAAAACVLAVVGIGSYFYFAAASHENDRLANKSPEPVQPGDKTPDAVVVPQVAKTGNVKSAEPKPTEGVQTAPPQVADQHSKPVAPLNPPPVSDPNKTLAIPKHHLESLEAVGAPLAFQLALRDLDKSELQSRLVRELQREPGYRLEVFSLGRGKALARLQTAFQARGIRLVIDPEAQIRLQNRRWRTDYAIYGEGLAPGEMAGILQQLGSDDRQAEIKRKGDGQFDKVLVLPLTGADRKELSTLLGADPLQYQKPRPKTPLGVDLHKPVSQKTAEQVVATLEGKRTPRPQPGKPAVVKGVDRLALVVPYNPVRTRTTASKEIKDFLNSLNEHRPGTFEIFLVVRGANG